MSLLQRLADAAGPPGAEEPVRAIMVPEMKPFATEAIRYDGMGSVIAQQGKAGPRIMIDAHMDELGGMVRRVTPNGFLTMQMLGGWLDQALVDQRWIILVEQGSGACGDGDPGISILCRRTSGRKVFPRDGLYLDIGASNAAEAAAMGVAPGDPVVPDAPFYGNEHGEQQLPGQGRGMTGSAMRSWWRRSVGRRRCRIRTSCSM